MPEQSLPTAGAPTAGLLTAQDIVRRFAARGLTIAIAESLTGGLLTAQLIDPAGASQVVNGGVVAYDTAIKASVLQVDRGLLDEHGPVHPEVARQLAANVRTVLAVGGREADVGIATTGVAGPEPQGEASVGTVFLGLADADGSHARELHLTGSRAEIRAATVEAAMAWLGEWLDDAAQKEPAAE